MIPTDIRTLTLRIFFQYQFRVLVATAPMAYLVSLTMGLEREQMITTAKYLVPLLLAPLGIIAPYLSIRAALRPGFDPSAPAYGRLYHLLRAPRVIETSILVSSLLGALAYAGLPSVYYGKGLWNTPWAVLLVGLLVLLLWIDLRLAIEKTLRPNIVSELQQLKNFDLKGGGYLWPRQKWYLPYAFGLYVICTTVILLTIIVKTSQNTLLEMLAAYQQQPGISAETLLGSFLDRLFNQVQWPLAILGTYMLVTAAMSAWRLAEHQSEGARAVQEAIKALASGSPKLPEWVSTDEVGDLALATAEAFGQLKSFSLSLSESAVNLRHSAEQLGQSTRQQMDMLTQQATALQETQVTTQEIKQTSSLTAQKASDVLKQTEQADIISRTGQAAIDKSLRGLEEIGAQVKEMARRIRELDDRAQQIANITIAVKDLADQSNMLALNAAIEAVRSGEHGKGFGVVAREIRSLADQSIEATQRVREILQDISQAISTTVEMTEKGSERIASSLVQVREFGSQMQELTAISQQNAASVRQITAAVTQQNTGIAQIVQAVADLSRLMDQTMSQLQVSDEALRVVNGVADKVLTLGSSYASQQAAQTRPARG